MSTGQFVDMSPEAVADRAAQVDRERAQRAFFESDPSQFQQASRADAANLKEVLDNLFGKKEEVEQQSFIFPAIALVFLVGAGYFFWTR